MSFTIDGTGRLTNFVPPTPDQPFNVRIPDGVTVIAPYVFYNLYLMRGLILPSSLTRIENNAFELCLQIRSFTIPPSVIYIGSSAFKNAIYFTDSITWDYKEGYAESDAFKGTYSSANLIITFNSQCTSIPANAFKGILGISNVLTIGSTVTTIGANAFDGCTNLNGVVIPSSVTTIGVESFKNCCGNSGENIVWTYKTGTAQSNSFTGCNNFYIIFDSQCTSIPANAFKGITQIKNILTFPSTVTTIGNNAFEGCTNLNGVSIPSSVTTIGVESFKNCCGRSGENIVWTYRTGTAQSNSFTGCNNFYIIFDGQCTSVTANALKGITQIKGVLTFPSTVTTIGASAFEGCTGLNGIVVASSSLISIGTSAFVGCTSANVTFKYLSGSISLTPFSGAKSFSLTFDPAITSISNNAFLGATWLSSVIIPSTITTIGDNAFNGCSNADITWIWKSGSGYINSFTGVKSFTLTFDPTLQIIPSRIIAGSTWLKGNVIIPSTVTIIGGEAFKNCTGITNVSIQPNSGTIAIGDGAFRDCTGLTKLTLTGPINYIGNIVFEGCSNLDITWQYKSGISRSDSFTGCKSFTLSFDPTIQTIPSSAFLGATWLTGFLEIPTSVTNIGNSAFEGCTGLTGSLILPQSIQTIGNKAFYGCTGFNGNLKLPEFIKTINNEVFYECSNLIGSLSIPASVTDIGTTAFYKCSKLTGNLTIPNSVKTIGPYAFSQFKSMTGSLTLSDSLTVIKDHAFSLSGFTGALKIPNSVTTIEPYAFESCSGLTSLILNPEIKNIGAGAFQNCTGLTGNLRLNYKNNIYIDESAFDGTGYTSKSIVYVCQTPTKYTDVIVPNGTGQVTAYVCGAAGGRYTGGRGGSGAFIKGQFTVAGQNSIRIYVGAKGEDSRFNPNNVYKDTRDSGYGLSSAGGGSSAIVDENGIILIVAGAGGGLGWYNEVSILGTSDSIQEPALITNTPSLVEFNRNGNNGGIAPNKSNITQYEQENWDRLHLFQGGSQGGLGYSGGGATSRCTLGNRFARYDYLNQEPLYGLFGGGIGGGCPGIERGGGGGGGYFSLFNGYVPNFVETFDSIYVNAILNSLQTGIPLYTSLSGMGGGVPTTYNQQYGGVGGLSAVDLRVTNMVKKVDNADDTNTQIFNEIGYRLDRGGNGFVILLFGF